MLQHALSGKAATFNHKLVFATERLGLLLELISNTMECISLKEKILCGVTASFVIQNTSNVTAEPLNMEEVFV